MEIIIGLLVVLLAYKEWRIHRLEERMMLQANIPQLTPVRVHRDSETETPAPVDTRRKIASIRIPS